MPKLAAFPKAFMQALCKDGSMKLTEWIALATQLDIDGLEWYAGFLEMAREADWPEFRKRVEDQGKVIPMLCCSPDFTHPDKGFRALEIAKQKRWIDMTRQLGGSFCRVLSGQRRPGLQTDEGLRYARESIEACLPFAKQCGVKLVLENHYKDDFWLYPEFVQKMELFVQLVDSIQDPDFGVNFDPSNALLAGEDPLVLLKRVSKRVMTMHASDRYLAQGSLEDLRQAESGTLGYASLLRHGEIGKGLNNYDDLCSELKREGFDGWISIEDGVDGMEQLQRSVQFMRGKIDAYWPKHEDL
jgi:sugar phosphate isomerase/epimerase